MARRRRDWDPRTSARSCCAAPPKKYSTLPSVAVRLVSAMPLPDAMPPAQVGRARRIDRAADIRALAKRWRNCLEIYLSDVDRGLCAFYRWDDSAPFACMIRRRGRFGWFFTEAKGPD